MSHNDMKQKDNQTSRKGRSHEQEPRTRVQAARTLSRHGTTSLTRCSQTQYRSSPFRPNKHERYIRNELIEGYAHPYLFDMIPHEFGDFKRQLLLRDELPIFLVVRRQNLIIGLSIALPVCSQWVAPSIFRFLPWKTEKTV